MSKTFNQLYNSIRGNVPLKAKQVHQDRKERPRREKKWWKEARNWEQE